MSAATLTDALTRLPALAFPPADAFGPIETVKLHPVQAFGGRFLARNWVSIPHVTHNDDLDVTALEEARAHLAASGRKVSIPVLIAKALAVVFEAFPRFNASLDADGQRLHLKKYVNIGMAVDTPNGLLVPVLKDVASRSAEDLSEELVSLAQQARSKGLPTSAMEGAGFTISSLGGLGGTSFTPIINAPDVAILGLVKTRWQPDRGDDGGLVWRRILPASLSYDHRVINGADAARFLTALNMQIAHLARSLHD